MIHKIYYTNGFYVYVSKSGSVWARSASHLFNIVSGYPHVGRYLQYEPKKGDMLIYESSNKDFNYNELKRSNPELFV